MRRGNISRFLEALLATPSAVAVIPSHLAAQGSRMSTAAPSIAQAAQVADRQLSVTRDSNTVRDAGTDAQSKSIYRVDLTMPDGPAFTLLNADASKAVRPGTIRELSLAAAGFTSSDGKSQIPKALAVEAHLLLLFGGRDLTVRDYQRMAWLARTRISIASSRGDTAKSATRVALGVRTSFRDHTDPRDRVNNNFRDSIYVRLDSLVCLDVARHLLSNHLDPNLRTPTPADIARLNKRSKEERQRAAKRLAVQVNSSERCLPLTGTAKKTSEISTVTHDTGDSKMPLSASDVGRTFSDVSDAR